MVAVRLSKPVRHNGELKHPDDLIPDLTETEAKRLVALGCGVIDEDVLPDAGEEDDMQDAGEPNFKSMSKSELIAELENRGVQLSGTENKAALVALLEQSNVENEDEA